MSPVVALALAILAVGAIAPAPGLILVGTLSLATSAASRLWRRGLDRVTYERRLGQDRAVPGDVVPLTVTVANSKILPLAWLQTDDFVTHGVRVQNAILSSSDRPGYDTLRNVWMLGPYESVQRTFHIIAEHRGRYAFEGLRLRVADVFGADAVTAEQDAPLAFLVRPRSVPVRYARGAMVPMGARSARRGLQEDPTLFAGVRPFQRGDPRRRIHERATARMGVPVSKRFDPSIARQVLVALDIQTRAGPTFMLHFDEDLVESLTVAALSIARRLLSDGSACGLAVNGWTYTLARTGFIPPRSGRDQVARIADLLARVSSVPSLEFGSLLARLPSRLPQGSIVLTISCRDIVRSAMALRRLRASGLEVRHVALGPDAREHAARLRRLGIEAAIGRLEPDWRSANVLTLAG